MRRAMCEAAYQTAREGLNKDGPGALRGVPAEGVGAYWPQIETRGLHVSI